MDPTYAVFTRCFSSLPTTICVGEISSVLPVDRVSLRRSLSWTFSRTLSPIDEDGRLGFPPSLFQRLVFQQITYYRSITLSLWGRIWIVVIDSIDLLESAPGHYDWTIDCCDSWETQGGAVKVVLFAQIRISPSFHHVKHTTPPDHSCQILLPSLAGPEEQDEVESSTEKRR